MFTTNSLGDNVISVSPYFYQDLSGSGFICCDEYQNYVYCFRSNAKQGCAFCELDETQPCECAVCEK
jgi:hypothetical protein